MVHETVAVITMMNLQDIRHGLPLETRAHNAYEIRHGARLKARSLMANNAEVIELQARDMEVYQNPHGPTFNQLIERSVAKGATNEEALENIIDSSKKTNANYNKKFEKKG